LITSVVDQSVRKGQQPPWIVSDELWVRIEPLLPVVVPRRSDRPGRPRLDDRKALCGILFVLYTAIPWEFLPQGAGVRLRDDLLIARRGTFHGSGLGKYRWVVEQTFALLHWFRRLRIRWEIRDDIHEAFLRLACAIICFRRLANLQLC
jgi:transposase